MYLWFLGTIYVPPEEFLPAAFYFFTVILCSLVNASLHNRPRPCTLKESLIK